MYGRFLVLFALMLTGYLLAKKKIFSDEATFAINRFIVYLSCPCMIVQKLANLDMKGELAKEFMIMLVLSVGIMYIGFVLCYLYSKARRYPRDISNVAELAMNSPNSAFMGFPVALLFFGDMGLFFMIAHNIALNIYFFSLGVVVLKRNERYDEMDRYGYDGKGRVSSRFGLRQLGRLGAELLTNVNIIASIVGMIICLNGIRIPEAVNEYFSYVGGVTIPMAMIYIGTSLTKSKMSEVFRNVRIIECSIVKLVVIPLFTMALVMFLPVSTTIKAMLVLGSCFPTAAIVTMVAQQEQQNAQFGCEVLFMSTLLSAISIPLFVKVIEMVF